MPKKKGELSIEERLEQSIVAKEEEPYKLPSNWVWTTWEEISDIFSSKRVLQKDWQKEGIPFYRTREIVALAKDELFSNELFISQEHYDSLAKETRMPKAGDLMVTGIGTIGICYLVKENDCFYYKDASVLCVSKKGDINSEYLKYLMKTPFMVSQIKKNSAGTTVDSLTINKYKTYKLPLPPLEEQKRIVEKLDSLFEKIQKIKEIIEEVKEKTTSRREAILSKAFSGELTEKWRGENKNFIPVDEILLRVENEKQELIKNKIIKKSSKIEPITENDILFDIPQSWKRIKLNDIAFVTKLAGFEYTKNIFPNLVEKGIPLFKGKNVQDGKIVYEFESYIPESISDELPRSQITKKCLLTPYVGTIGNIALFEGNFKAHLGSNVGKIEVFNNFNENILEKYLLYYFRSCYGLAQLKKHRKATAQESISIEAIRDCVIILPPLEEQKEIVRVLDKIFEEENRISELISLENKIEILEKTILDRAFRGELGTGNNDDEPAIELLKKCLEER
ncbi:MAG: restriction endonuclease subunit S [Fusobacterium sp.]|uniref:restriction endonuclease subunit S n=1 Tax=Fusobacterium sp. TaxID=68766 RepID=UPI00399962D6